MRQRRQVSYALLGWTAKDGGGDAIRVVQSCRPRPEALTEGFGEIKDLRLENLYVPDNAHCPQVFAVRPFKAFQDGNHAVRIAGDRSRFAFLEFVKNDHAKSALGRCQDSSGD